MSQEGWVSIHRQLRECWIWDEKPFDRTHAWIDLLLSANHQENKTRIGNELTIIERGSFITSELKLMEKWGWSKTKLRSFLKLLEEDNMIIKKSDKKKTTITIVNYSTYQDSGNHEKTIEEPQEDHKKTIKKLKKDTNNNDNNVNNDNKKYIYSENSLLEEAIKDFIKMRKSIKKPMTEKAITLMLNNLRKISSDENTQIEILNQSIVNSWQGVFPLKDNKGGFNNEPINFNRQNTNTSERKYAGFTVNQKPITDEELENFDYSDLL